MIQARVCACRTTWMRLFTIEERRGFPALTRTRRQQCAALLDADDAVDQTSGLRHEKRPHMKYKPISTSRSLIPRSRSTSWASGACADSRSHAHRGLAAGGITPRCGLL